MGNDRLPERTFLICNNAIELNKVKKAISDFGVSITVNKKLYTERTRDTYPDYTTFNSYRLSDKLYNSGLYYGQLAKQMFEITGVNTNEIKIIKQASMLYFKDAVLIKRKEPAYVYQLSKFVYDTEVFDKQSCKNEQLIRPSS